MLSQSRGQVLTCYSPVRHFTRIPKDTFSFDLHVLSMPPAFVLSQDQTLQFKFLKRIIDPYFLKLSNYYSSIELTGCLFNVFALNKSTLVFFSKNLNQVAVVNRQGRNIVTQPDSVKAFFHHAAPLSYALINNNIFLLMHGQINN